jgi:putative SOS response-associated peptidase YedK
MCGRFTLRSPANRVAEAFALAEPVELRPRYNVAPSQTVAVVRLEDDQRRLVQLKWGLIPSWADDPAVGYKMINARAETAASKPSFRSAYKSRRCLIVADGFYEWQKVGAKKQPYYIRMKGQRPFGLAGLWERWKRDEQEIESYTILTTEANELMAPIHNRMPVIVAPDDYQLWLDTGASLDRLPELLKPYPGDTLEAFQVSTVVNNPRNDVPECVEAVGT